jgi:hypothetical protein
MARSLSLESRCADPVSIEHLGKVIRQFVFTADGRVDEKVLV